MKFINLTILLCTISLFGVSQKLIFDENFKSNRNKWTVVDDSEFLVKINRGTLHIEKLKRNRISNGCLWYRKSIPNFNAENDFSIIFYAKVISYGDISKMIDFQWGSIADNDSLLSKDSIYQINIAPDQIRLSSFFAGKLDEPEFVSFWENLTDSSDNLMKSLMYFEKPSWEKKFNKYEIIQQGDTCIIKINDIEVYRTEIVRIRGSEIGIQQCLKSSWKIKKLQIRQ